MVVGSQIIGVLFGTFMIYLTFIRYKRNEFTTKETVFWIFIWAGIISIAFFPKTLDVLSIQVLQFARTFDLLIMLAFMFLIAAIFYTYGLVRKNQKKLEEMVRKIAIEKEK